MLYRRLLDLFQFLEDVCRLLNSAWAQGHRTRHNKNKIVYLNQNYYSSIVSFFCFIKPLLNDTKCVLVIFQLFNQGLFYLFIYLFFGDDLMQYSKQSYSSLYRHSPKSSTQKKMMTLHVYYAGLMNKYKQNHLIYVTHKLFNRII